MVSMRTLATILPLAFVAAGLVSPCWADGLPAAIEARLNEQFTQFASQHGDLFERVDPNDYRHPYEKRIVAKLMEDQKIKDLLPEAQRQVAEMNRAQHNAHLLQGVLCSPTQFPEIYKMAQENAAALAMKPGFKIYVMNSAEMNAYTWSVDQDNYGVAIFSGIIRALSREELKYVMGHEMGHVKSQHILTSTLIQMYYDKYKALPALFSEDTSNSTTTKPAGTTTVALGLQDLPRGIAGDIARSIDGGTVQPLNISDTEYSNLNRLQQDMEYSADRAGLVASGRRQDAMMGLVKLASGQVGDLGGFDMAAYLAQIEAVLGRMTHSELVDLMANEGSHAFTLMRVGELDLFANSQEFARASDAKSASVYREIVSAYFQINSVLADAVTGLKKFEAASTTGEMNALERRMKEKEFNDKIEPRQGAVTVLEPLVLDPIFEIGLTVPNAAFDMYTSYCVLRASGVPLKALTDKIIEKIKFALNDPQATPEARAELQRKLTVAKKVHDLAPASTNPTGATTGTTPPAPAHN